MEWWNNGIVVWGGGFSLLNWFGLFALIQSKR